MPHTDIEMPPKGRKGAAAGSVGNPGRVCKPSVSKLPATLLPLPKSEGVPVPIVESLTEFRNSQPFFSALERLDPECSTIRRMNSCWLGISGETVAALHRPDSEDGFGGTLELTDGSQHPVFIKRIHIINPIDVIEGECIYPREGSLPAPGEIWMTALEKLNDPLNEAYVDAVFANVADRMVQTGLSPHWLRCYGTFPARVEKYQYNISDEYPSLRRKSFWTKHQEMGLFTLHKEAAESEDGTRQNRAAIAFSESEDLAMGDFEVAAVTHSAPSSSREDETAAEADVAILEDAESVTLSAPAVRIQRIEGSVSSSETSETSESDEEFVEYFAEFTDFPVQVTLLEKAEGTMDDLMDAEEYGEGWETRWKAWIFQVIAALVAAQHWFGFAHNDLHTNNVMWSRTDKPYLYYSAKKSNGKTTLFKVPTFGYIMKVIDFGRASFHLPSGFFISDAFYPGNDAAHQYNCEPFFDSRNGKKVEPNPSFDLCRLSVSMLESLFPKRPEIAHPITIMSREGSKTYATTVSPLYNLLWEWVTDDEGKNMLRLPNGEERYPDFDLYSAIAEDVHKAVPSQQIEKALFAEFHTDAAPSAETMYDLPLR
jgi:hypothetical protein